MATVGTVGILVGLLDGCDSDPAASGPTAPAGSGGPTGSPTSSPASPDELLVARAVDRIEAVAALVSLTSQRRPRLADGLAPLLALHAAHRRALGDTTPTPTPTSPVPPVPRSRRQALAVVVGAEEELSAQLAHLAGRSESGELARLLASMAAGVHLHVVQPGPQSSTTVPPLARVARRPPAEVAVLQRALAAEHAAVYVYGVLGAQTSQTDPATAALFAALTEAYGAHVSRREDLVAVLVAARATPVAAAPAYDVSSRLDRRRVVERTAAGLESACAAVQAYVVAQTAGPTRRWAIATLRSTSVRELAFRGTPETFPGADEFADR